MKASNLSTPRTLGDCTFIASHDPIERHRPPTNLPGIATWLVCLGLAVAAVATIVSR